MIQNGNSKQKIGRYALLFVYGFEWCNPNGDPAFDNEPRTYEGRVVVTDVFLKRRIRDYVDSNIKKDGYKIFLKEVVKDSGERETIVERLKDILEKKENEEVKREDLEQLKNKCWDIRVFGCMIPIRAKGKKEEEKGLGLTLIGPVQASFGLSLNKVEKLGFTITNVMPSIEEKAKGGAIGKKYVVPVAIVEQFIFVNDISAEETRMTEEDYTILEEALKNLRLSPTCSTSSKNLLTPLLLVKVKLKEKKYLNLFGLLECRERNENKKPISIRDYIINCQKLKNKLEELKDFYEKYEIFVKKEYYDIFEGLDGLSIQTF